MEERERGGVGTGHRSSKLVLFHVLFDELQSCSQGKCQNNLRLIFVSLIYFLNICRYKGRYIIQYILFL